MGTWGWGAEGAEAHPTHAQALVLLAPAGPLSHVWHKPGGGGGGGRGQRSKVAAARLLCGGGEVRHLLEPTAMKMNCGCAAGAVRCQWYACVQETVGVEQQLHHHPPFLPPHACTHSTGPGDAGGLGPAAPLPRGGGGGPAKKSGPRGGRRRSTVFDARRPRGRRGGMVGCCRRTRRSAPPPAVGGSPDARS